uniref:Uncharacterized protein n=1 Tax=Anopheles coluzzii TaxID=1518534 RepID=A0A8W7PN40_ANOCL
MCIYLPGYCQRAGGVRTAFCTAALVTPIATVSGARGIMVELVPVKNMFWLSPGVAQPVKRSAESEPNALIACHTLRRCGGGAMQLGQGRAWCTRGASVRLSDRNGRSAVVPTVPFSEPPLVAAAAAAAASPTLYRFSSFVGCSWDAGVVALSWSRWRATAMPTGMEATDEAVVLVVVPGGWVVECCCVLLVVPDASPSCSIVAATALELALAPPPVPSVALPEVPVLPPTAYK